MRIQFLVVKAGYNLTTGSNNIAIGSNALMGTNTESDNTAVGHHALKDLTGGQYNVAVGSYAADDFLHNC